ncbi:MAG: hypothetical protein ABEI58_00845 [Candidatus Nanohaloarchaea archaeon]
MKGQIHIEFLAAAFIYLIALAALVTLGSGAMPSFSGDVTEASLNLEARQVSTKMLSNPGGHSYSGGGTDWEANNDTVREANAVGLADGFLDLERDKIMRLRTINPRNNDFNYLNYSQFKDITGADHQYRFNFTWMPVIETHRTFTKGQGDSVSPSITEPQIRDADGDLTYYGRAGNEIHYGSAVLRGKTYNFLVTSHNGVYNTTYVSRTWDFRNERIFGRGDRLYEYPGEYYVLDSFQNREDEPGSILVLQSHLKTFGASIDDDSQVIRLQRFATMESEPLKVEVWTW